MLKTTNKVVLVVLILGGIGWSLNLSLNNNQNSTINDNGKTVNQTNIDGNSNNQTTYNIGIPYEQYKKDLEEIQHKLSTALADKALSEQKQSDLKKELTVVKNRLAEPSASYQTHIKELNQRIEELNRLVAGTIPKTLLKDAIIALKTGDTEKADAIFTKVEQSAQGHIEAAAEAAYQRAKIAEEDIEYRLALQHAQRAAQLMPSKGRYLNLAGVIANTLGEYDKAIGYYKQAVNIALKKLGEKHPTTKIFKRNLLSAQNLNN